MSPSAADRYTVRIDPQQQRISVSIGGEEGASARTFRIAPASRSDRGLLAGALAQTCLALQDRETQIQLLQEQLAVATRQLFGASSERKPCETAPEEAEAAPDDHDAATETPMRPTMRQIEMCCRSSAAPGASRWRQTCRASGRNIICRRTASARTAMERCARCRPTSPSN